MCQRIVAILMIAFLHLVPISAQFYNGHKMTFGKNRVQYNNFYWNYQRYDQFDTYFNEFGVQLAKHTAQYVKNEIPKIESEFEISLERRIIFVIYNKLTDFRQSNIGLITGNAESNIGGVFNVSNNKVFVYFEGDYDKFEAQIRKGIAQVFVNQMIYGSDFRTNATNSTLINLPEWYVNGLTSYLSDSWTIENDNILRDKIVSGKYKKFNRLTGNDAVLAGHSFWRYIGQTYGEAVMPDILYMTKVQKNINTGFLFTIGFKLKVLSKDWYNEKFRQYTNFDQQAELPEGDPVFKRPRKDHIYSQVNVSPTGNYMAYVTNHMGKYKIWLYDTRTGKKKKIMQQGHKLEQIVDNSFPVMAWHPSGRYLAFMVEEKGGLSLYYYTFGERKLTRRNFMGFEKVLDFSFSSDGSQLVLSAVKNGQSDIFVHSNAASTNYQVTNDKAEDFSPRFINNSNQIIFSSNRVSDTIKPKNGNAKRAANFELYIYDFKSRSHKLMPLKDSDYNSKSAPVQVGENQFVSLQNNNGILNRYLSEFDSAISHVDTAVHYRYYAVSKPLTNYKRNILEQDYHPSQNLLGQVLFNKGRYFMYLKPFDANYNDYSQLPKTLFSSELKEKYRFRDSLNKQQITLMPLDSIYNNTIAHSDDTYSFPYQPIDINNYVFEVEKIGFYNERLKAQKSDLKIVKEIDSEVPLILIYNEVFFQNYIVSQVDFSFLSESYQAFTGGAVYYNPGINLAFKLGIQDLFENLKLTGGMSLPFDFASSEYLVSLENLKYRLDWQAVYHRHTYLNSLNNQQGGIAKTITNQGYGIVRFPFSQVFAWSNTVGLRDDQVILVQNEAAPTTVLNSSPEHKVWLTAKTELVFDNTRTLGVNLREGSRWKVFGEFYQQLNDQYSNLYVVGADFRNYLVIHRNFILANRLAYSSSMGNSKLLYYLGAVDDWINVTPLKHPTFIPQSEIRIDPDANYAYQSTATNLRGFSQNIRNGNNFVVVNSELRFPVISYFISTPLSNAFLENFQVIGFFDLGTAWTGLHPWKLESAYNTDYIRQGDIEIEIDAQRDPLVAGYGFGVRSQLFGYFIRLDWAWGIENKQVLPRIFYLSLSLDF